MYSALVIAYVYIYAYIYAYTVLGTAANWKLCWKVLLLLSILFISGHLDPARDMILSARVFTHRMVDQIWIRIKWQSYLYLPELVTTANPPHPTPHNNNPPTSEKSYFYHELLPNVSGNNIYAKCKSILAHSLSLELPMQQMPYLLQKQVCNLDVTNSIYCRPTF